MNTIRKLGIEELESRTAPALLPELPAMAAGIPEFVQLLGTSTTDEDGYYLIRYQHIGAPANYTVK